jgi:hypothetical protein
MRKALLVSGALAVSALPLMAQTASQTARWNDRPTATWTDEAPRVRVWIDGARSVSFGASMRVRFEVSDNAYVTVVRVDDQGRMTILFPYSRNQRAAARGDYIHDVRNPRVGGQHAFYATDRMGGGYVFALASYAPLDFSSFENRDYDRIGGYSRWTQANRDYARRPDVFIDRFAARVLWDVNTPYDYDVDYYWPGGSHNIMSVRNSLAMCSALYDQFGAHSFGSAFMFDWDNLGFVSMPYRALCRSYYQQARCMWFGVSYAACNFGTVIAQGPTGPVGGQPTDTGGTTVVPNEGVIKGGLFAPTPLPVPVGAGADPVPAERPIGRYDRPDGTELDDLKSIPTRATRKMKEDDARREATGAAPARTSFDRTEAANKPDKSRVADNDAVTRVNPPSRQPTKSKGVSEPQRDSRAKGGYGNTGRTSEPRSSGPERVNRPDTRTGSGATSANPPSIQSAPTGDKKKPPQD